MNNFTPPINLSFEEIRDMSEKGTLDQYILSNGYRYQDVLRFALELADEKVSSIEDNFNDVETLLDKIDSLEEEVSHLQDCLNEQCNCED